MHLFATTTAEQILQVGKMAAVMDVMMDVNQPHGADLVGEGRVSLDPGIVTFPVQRRSNPRHDAGANLGPIPLSLP